MTMHAFERALLREIPAGEAMGFFHRLKTAGWADPPDEAGVLEGQFAAPIEQVLMKLTEAVTAKFKLMVAYHVYAESMRGVAQHGVSEVFHEHAEQERAAAEAYLKRAAVLGGGPIHLPEIETPPASADPVGILMMVVRAEQEAIALQSELKSMVGDQNPLAFQIEQFMIEDQHHHDEAWQMLPQDIQHSMIAPTADPMAAEDPMAGAPPPEAGPPAEPPMAEGPPAGAAPPAPKPKAEAKPEPKPDVAKMAAAMRKAAGDLIQFPGKAERMARSAKGGARELMQTVGNKLTGLPPTAKAMLAAGGYGATLGGIGGAVSDLHRSPEEEDKLRENGGPVTDFALRHPALSGAMMGGATLAGGVGGVMLGSHLNKPILSIPAGIAGLMAPRVLASVADKVLKHPGGEEAGYKEAAARFQAALKKLGYAGPAEPGFGNDPGAAPIPSDEPMAAPMPSMQQPGEQPPMANPPNSQQFSPVNYLEAEETARRAQAGNEAEFYRNQAQTATGQVQSMGQQIQQVQSQLDQLSQQAAESQSQVMQANEQAVQANDQMLNQATLAARMRMGMQQLRAQMMEIASQDPEQLAAAAGGPTPMDVGNQAQMAAGGAAPAGAAPPGTGLNGEAQVTGDPSGGGDPGAQPGAAGATPDAAAAPGAAPGGAGTPDGAPSAPSESQSSSDSGAKKTPAETTVSIKKASLASELRGAAPYAAGGALLGAAGGYMDAKSGKQVNTLRDQVDVLKGQQVEGGFGKALELAQAQMALSKAEEQRASPMRSALKGGLAGAATGAGLGMAIPAAIGGAKTLAKNIQSYRNI